MVNWTGRPCQLVRRQHVLHPHAEEVGGGEAVTVRDGDPGEVSPVLAPLVLDHHRLGLEHVPWEPLPAALEPLGPRRLPVVQHDLACARIFRAGGVFFLQLISPGQLHVRPMGCTCRWAGEIELTAIGVKLNGSRRVLFVR